MENKLAIHPRERIKLIKSNFSIGLLLLGNLADPKKKEASIKNRVVIDEEGIYFIPEGSSKYIEPNKKFYTFEMAGNPNLNFRHAILEFSKMLIRNATIDAFESFKNYCKTTNQTDLFKKQQWYIFTWLVRNCLTHNQKVIFKNYHKSFLPSTWDGNTIDLSLENKELPFTIYGYFQCCALLDEMTVFAEILI